LENLIISSILPSMSKKIKISAILLLLVIIPVFSQESYENRSDSLYIAFKDKLKEWKIVEIEMKFPDMSYHDNKLFTKAKSKWDSLNSIYNALWEESEGIKKQWLLLTKKDDHELHPEPPPPPPPPYFHTIDITNHDDYLLQTRRPSILDSSYVKIKEYVKGHYPSSALQDNIIHRFLVRFILAENGKPKDIEVGYYNYDKNIRNTDLRELTFDILKLAEYTPAIYKKTGNPVEIRMSQVLIFKTSLVNGERVGNVEIQYPVSF
jgi:hypothetical protein